MQHTLIAVFDNQGDAERAREDLVAAGFPRPDSLLSEGEAAGQGASAAQETPPAHPEIHSLGASIRKFFSDMFGTERSESARMYSEAVTRGHYVLTLVAANEPEVERAAGIVERWGPIDIDEHAQAWRAGAAAQDAARGARQQAAPASQQFAPPLQQEAPAQQAGMAQGAMPQQAASPGSMQRAGDTTAIPVIQEELRIGKRQVSRGGVRIFQHVVETPVSESVGLREEHISVERHAVDRPASPADVNAFRESTIELRETAEEAVVEKTARVVEEVVVGKEVRQHDEKISGTVRRTEVDIEQLAPEDDAYFRGHWSSNFAAAGGSYEDYAPAYSYGSSMAGSDLYRGRAWDEVEGSLRADWEARHPQSAWETVKAAIRHGWERITG